MSDFPTWARTIPVSEIMPRLVMEKGGTAEEARRVAALAGPEPVPATFDGWLALARRLLDAVRAEGAH